MSFDDGSLGEREAGTPADGRRGRGPLAWGRAVLGTLRTHVREWPRRYVDQQSALYESGDRE
ncbi:MULTISPECIES: hypothetical protein [Salinibaculum]|uniref:hypothetical protein n=1 Tax=Salinibaculum TaxID=2732368 RepID=UPI0030D34772